MKKIMFGLSIASLVALLTACGGGNQSAPAPTNQGNTTTPAPSGNAAPAPSGNSANATAAEGIFKQTCAGCHGVDLKGAVGPNLTQVGARYSKDQILGIIGNGKGAMPPGLLKGADADAVATWLAAKK